MWHVLLVLSMCTMYYRTCTNMYYRYVLTICTPIYRYVLCTIDVYYRCVLKLLCTMSYALSTLDVHVRPNFFTGYWVLDIVKPHTDIGIPRLLLCTLSLYSVLCLSVSLYSVLCTLSSVLSPLYSVLSLCTLYTPRIASNRWQVEM
jgi:hypothetical protein